MIMICFVFIVFGVLEIKSNGQRIDTGTRIHTHVYAALAFGIYSGIAGEGKHVLHHERCVERAPLRNLPEVVRQLHVVHLQERGVLDIEVALILPFPEVCIQIAGVEAVELVAVHAVVIVKNSGYGEFALLYALVHRSTQVFVFEQDENIASMLTYCAKDIVDNLEVIDNMDIDKEKYPDAKVFSL